MPVSDDKVKDHEIFLKILAMDEEGLYRRKNKSISLKEVVKQLNPREIDKYCEQSNDEETKYKRGLSRDEKTHIQKLVFNRLSYDDKLKYCVRLEHIANLSKNT